ncbi:long-chain fatty acid--CoA ligase [Actinomycetospora endophytica]|uniref:Long-chain fatty acid--CoA ligase n=1 Tax=Actinomycetospora endophytica TaxID=2291215 RepID=A0ABS8PAK7_9PSEU|nr:long-chain fatty acid--CoA ligase [Actinomycetospora endophytica]MCD2195284.1 long-chain fatty acid--CoA ligase [Actinomycetospora endophytica]
MNLAMNLGRTAAAHPLRTALRYQGNGISYAEIDDLSGRVAAILRADGLSPGDRVAIMVGNVPQFALAYYGVLRAGGVVVPMNPLLKSREVAFQLADCGARRIVCTGLGQAEAATGAQEAGAHLVDIEAEGPSDPEIVPRAGDDTAVVLYTSGTTGTPKGAELTHANLTRNAEITARNLLHLTTDDVVFGGLPLFHAFGQTCALNAAIGAGATLCLMARFDADAALAMMRDERVTVFAGVPTMYGALFHAAADGSLPDLRTCISGGAALPVEVLNAFEKTFDCLVLEGYGLSETSPVASFNHPDRPRKPGSIGTPVEGVEMRLVDAQWNTVPAGQSGEIAIRGHNVMKGYWGRPEATATVMSDGWFRTGDIGTVDDDGYFTIVDRAKDLIIRGGYNVYPREIEEVLYEHPAIAEAAVIGIKHPELGEEVAAAVALRPDASVTPEELREFVKARVAAYKYPRRVWIEAALPKGATGKILKREITVPAEMV